MTDFIHELRTPSGSTRPLDAVEEAAYYCERVWREGVVDLVDEGSHLPGNHYPTWRRADDILWDLVGGVSTKYQSAVVWAEENYDNITPVHPQTAAP